MFLFRPVSLLVPVLVAALAAGAIALAAGDRGDSSRGRTATRSDPGMPASPSERSALPPGAAGGGAAPAPGRGRRSPARPRERIRWRRSLALGSPAKVIRKLRPDELRMLAQSERSYVALARKHRVSSFVVFGR